jgi:uncharacterized protein YrrD
MDLGDPASYLTLGAGAPVFSSDGQKLGEVEHVLAEPGADVFDGIVIDASPLPGGHRFVDAPQVDRIYDRGVVLGIDASAAERLPEPSANPAALRATPDDVAEDERETLERKLRRAWDRISGNY